MEDKRCFVRHPLCFPLKFKVLENKNYKKSLTKDISEGGLCFLTGQKVDVDTVISMELPVIDKVFKIKAKVVYSCESSDNPNMRQIGVCFLKYADAFKVKLIEQIYLIDEYRSLMSFQKEREVSFMEASSQWSKKYAERFEHLFWKGHAPKDDKK